MKVVEGLGLGSDSGYFGFGRAHASSSETRWEVPGHVPASPYSIRIARTALQLQTAVEVRYQAYSEKLQALASKVKQPGPLDYEHEPVVLLAESRLTGEAVGTLRLNTGPGILGMLDDIDLPDNILGERVAFVSRMAVVGTVHERQLVRNLMQKACFQLCIAKQLNRMLLLAVEPRERLFYRCGFSDVFEDGKARHPAFLEHFPVKALYADTYGMERHWKEQKHPLYDFLFRTFHPEIEVFSSLSSLGHRSNEPARAMREMQTIEPLWVV
jgi:hypothetical protein